MLAAQRKELLLDRLRVDGRLVAKDLAAELGMSEDSIRRDLRELADAGLCQRVYGGAMPDLAGRCELRAPAGDRDDEQAARGRRRCVADPAGQHGDPRRRHHRARGRTRCCRATSRSP